MMKSLTVAGSAAISCVVVVCLAVEPKSDQTPSYWMQKKLEYSSKILEGLAAEDFEGISQTARSMKALNQMEKWARSGLPEYRAQLQVFQNANERLIRTADDKNLDGAALAYVQLTLSCVHCHKIVRDSDPKKSRDAR